jgi:undecaprenyl-diphosphatase
MPPKNARPWSRDPTPGIAVAIAGIALVGFLVLTTAVLFFPAFQTIDARITGVMRDVSAPSADALARSLTFLGDTWVMVALTVLGAAWLLIRGHRVEAVLLAAVMVIGPAVGALLKGFVERARPGLEVARIPVPESYSFPSGHALAAFLFFGIVAFLIFVMARTSRLKLWGWFVCSALAFGVALSRVYLGVHYVGDIIASWMLGSAFLLAAVLAYVWWVTRDRVSAGAKPGES